MSITPAEAARKRNENRYPEIKFHVARIDEYLTIASPSRGGEWRYSIDGMDQEFALKLMEAYRDAGWCVRHISNRDGSALVFSEPA